MDCADSASIQGLSRLARQENAHDVTARSFTWNSVSLRSAAADIDARNGVCGNSSPELAQAVFASPCVEASLHGRSADAERALNRGMSGISSTDTA